MCVSITGLGDRVVRINGLPIGGLCQKLLQVSFLSQEEREWNENEVRQANLGYHKTDDDGHRWRAARGMWMTSW